MSFDAFTRDFFKTVFTGVDSKDVVVLSYTDGKGVRKTIAVSSLYHDYVQGFSLTKTANELENALEDMVSYLGSRYDHVTRPILTRCEVSSNIPICVNFRRVTDLQVLVIPRECVTTKLVDLLSYNEHRARIKILRCRADHTVLDEEPDTDAWSDSYWEDSGN